ncbi:MAG: flagellar FlbD family protein [Ignavibacteriota bacterium]
MIYVTRLNRKPLVLNSDLIEQIEMTPDTVISLTTGEKIVVRESSDELVERVVNFRRSISTGESRPLPPKRVAQVEPDGGR